MGRAMENCCFCNGGSSTLPPTNSPTLSVSPSITAQPTRTCFDNPNWKDRRNNTCSDYEDFDTPGCPVYGKGDGGVLGTAGENCCYCGGGFYALPSTSSEAVTMSHTRMILSPRDPPSTFFPWNCKVQTPSLTIVHE